MTVRLTWKPKEGLKLMIRRLNNRGPLVRKCQNIMLAMVNETHRHAGMPPWVKSKRAIDEGGRTGYKSGDLQRAWRPVPGKMRIENNKSYAVDFYYGHPRRRVTVPAHYRSRPKGQTGNKILVKQHTRIERAQPARPVRWTKRYIRKVEDEILIHVLK